MQSIWDQSCITNDYTKPIDWFDLKFREKEYTFEVEINTTTVAVGIYCYRISAVDDHWLWGDEWVETAEYEIFVDVTNEPPLKIRDAHLMSTSSYFDEYYEEQLFYDKEDYPLAIVSVESCNYVNY